MKPLLLSLGFYLVLFLCPLSSNAGEDFVVHEWGTFTSVQASDGQLLYWNSLNPSDLPAFVYNRTQAQADRELNSLFAFGGKFNLSALHRMETPVLYFYSPTQRHLDVTAKFPKGLITEWYPQVRQFGPIYTTNDSPYLNPGHKTESFVKWEQVEILPAATHPVFKNGLPKSHAPSHYFAARNTDADFVRISKTIKGDQVRELEKFLFYRGLGLPLLWNHPDLGSGDRAASKKTGGQWRNTPSFDHGPWGRV